MIKHLITATSFVLGGAGVVLVGYLSTHPRAFTHPVAALPSVAVSGAAAAIPVAIEPAGNGIIDPAGATAERRARNLCDQPGDQR
jgi:hypothetical protein